MKKLVVVNDLCKKCGKEHVTETGLPACGGHRKAARGGAGCRKVAGWGTDHVGYGTCKYHGGCTPPHEKHAQRLMTADAMAVILDNPDADAIADPLNELLQLAGRIKHASVVIGQRVNTLNQYRNEDAAAQARSSDGGDIRFVDHKGAEQIRGEVAVWERLLNQLGRLLTDIARLGIEERLTKIQEAQADAVIRAVDAWCTERGMTGAEAAEARGAIARHLHAVSS